jgi:hypothetical protein
MAIRKKLISVGLVIALVVIGIGAIWVRDPRLYAWILVDYIDADPETNFITAKEIRLQPSLAWQNRGRLLGGSLDFSLSEVSGKIGCNSYSGDYRLNPLTQTLAVDKLFMTLMLCDWRGGHDTFLPQLERVTRYEYHGETLRMYADGDQTVLVFKKVGFSSPIELFIKRVRDWINWLLTWLQVSDVSRSIIHGEARQPPQKYPIRTSATCCWA